MLLAPTEQLGVAIGGVPGTGNRLTAYPSPGLFGTYQWKADGVAIGGATLGYYDQLLGDLGKTITVELSGRYFASAGLYLPPPSSTAPGAISLDGGGNVLLGSDYLVLS